MSLFKDLVKDGVIVRKSGDFSKRQGLTIEPLSSSDQKSITITHSYINGTSWFLKLLYQCHIDCRIWNAKKNTSSFQNICQSKNNVLKHTQNETGLYLDQCSRSGGNGGTSTNGPQGRRFFLKNSYSR